MKSVRVNGPAIAAEVSKRVALALHNLPQQLVVAFVFGDNDASKVYLKVKEKAAAELGIRFQHLASDASDTKTALRFIQQKIVELAPQGAIVQLPLPKGMEAQPILDAIPVTVDIDILSQKGFERFRAGETRALPPVVGAIDEILKQHKVLLSKKQVVLVGAGVLVGKPAAAYFQQRGAQVTVCDKNTLNIEEKTRSADILVTGAGAPHLITSDYVKRGVVVLDAGFSRKAGKIVGDVDPRVANKASLFSPVPGGIGGITVVKLFENLVLLQKEALV